jgi:hypothetical protein
MKTFSQEYNFFRPAYWFGMVDARPLSLFRIFFAALLFKNAFYLLFLAETFYSDEGVTPRAAFWEITRINRFSLMDAMPHTWMAQVFFACWMVVAGCLLLGYRTRLMVVLNFIIIASVHERNFVVLNGADLVARMLSFWAMFIPLGEYYSLDALRHRWQLFRFTRNIADLRPPDSPRLIYALPVRLIQIQVALVYIFTFVLKLPGKPWHDGTALYYALQVQSLVLPWGVWFQEHMPLMVFKLGSYFALIMESGFVFFVFLPLVQPLMRGFGLLLGVIMHLGIAVLMSIQDFSAVMIISYFTFWEPSWVSWCDQKLRAPTRPLQLPIPFGNSPLWILLGMTPENAIRLTHDLDGDSGCDEWTIYDEEGNAYQGVAAWRLAAGHLPLSRLWVWLLNIIPLRWLIWNGLTWMQRLQPPPLTFGGFSSEPTILPTRRWFTWAGRALMSLPLLALMGMVIWWNLATVKDENDEPLVPYVSGTPRTIMQYLSLGQSWGMFAPFPTTDDGWITVPARFENGLVIDLMTGEPPSDSMTHYYWGPKSRWKKYSSEMWGEGYESLLRAWGGSMCRKYNIDGNLPQGQRLATLEIIYNWRWSHAPDEEPHPWQQSRIWRHWCYKEYREE